MSFFGTTVLSAALMKEAFTHTGALVGRETFAHLDTSSVLALVVTNSSTLTGSPFFRRTITSLLMAAWARTLTLGCVTIAGPVDTGAGFIGSAAAVSFLDAAGFLAVAAFFFFAEESELAFGALPGAGPGWSSARRGWAAKPAISVTAKTNGFIFIFVGVEI